MPARSKHCQPLGAHHTLRRASLSTRRTPGLGSTCNCLPNGGPSSVHKCRPAATTALAGYLLQPSPLRSSPCGKNTRTDTTTSCHIMDTLPGRMLRPAELEALPRCTPRAANDSCGDRSINRAGPLSGRGHRHPGAARRRRHICSTESPGAGGRPRSGLPAAHCGIFDSDSFAAARLRPLTPTHATRRAHVRRSNAALQIRAPDQHNGRTPANAAASSMRRSATSERDAHTWGEHHAKRVGTSASQHSEFEAMRLRISVQTPAAWKPTCALVRKSESNKPPESHRYEDAKRRHNCMRNQTQAARPLTF